MKRLVSKTVLIGAAGAFLLLFGAAIPCPAAVEESCLGPGEGATIKISDTAFLRINYQMQLYGQWRDTGSGTDGTKPSSDFYFRRNRLTFSGQASELLSYAVKIEQAGPRTIYPLEVTQEAASDLDIIEAYATADFAKGFKVTAGQEKIPFTREVLEGCFSPLSIDRSLFIYTPMQRSRDTGVVLWGDIATGKGKYYFAVMDGKEGAAPQGMPRLTARAHLALLDPENGYGYQGTYLGEKMVFTIGGGVQYEPGAVYTNTVARTGDNDYTAWTADVFFEYPVGLSGIATVSAAYLETDFNDAYKGSNPDPDVIGIDGTKKGWYAKAGYLLQKRIGPGQIQPYVRYEQWKFAQLNGIYNQQLTWLGAGINYLIKGQRIRISAECAQTAYDKKDLDNQDFITGTLMLQLEF